jgi:hypothetical protein
MSSSLNHVEALKRVEDLEGVLGAVATIALQMPETEHSCRRALKQIGALTRESHRTRPTGGLGNDRARTTLVDHTRSSN